MRMEAEGTPCILGRGHKSCRSGSRAATESTRAVLGVSGLSAPSSPTVVRRDAALLVSVFSGGRQPTRTNCRGVPSAGLSCVADIYLVVPRMVTDRSGYYMPADQPSSQTDLVATPGAKPLKQRKRPESYSKPALRS